MDYLEFEEPIVKLEQRIAELEKFTQDEEIECSEEVRLLRSKLDSMTKDIYRGLTPWQRIQLSRHPQRPYTRDYIDLLCSDFVEIRGDRRFADDPALVCGFGQIDGRTLAIVGHQKGREIKDKMSCHFGCAHPEGYRKAYRLMKLAEQLDVPVVALIDTPGAFPGIAAEERGQSEAIAFNIMQMTTLRVPTIGIVIGEGGSGGALGIGLTDVSAIMSNAYYSVISPEGCAAILWKDQAKAPDAAEALKIMPKNLLEMGIVDEIIEEPLGGAHRNYEKAAEQMKSAIFKYLNVCESMSVDELLRRRYEKYRQMGEFHES